jgi:hypothetical protein
VRSNLDPFGERDDAAVWAALDQVGLRDLRPLSVSFGLNPIGLRSVCLISCLISWTSSFQGARDQAGLRLSCIDSNLVYIV